MSLPAEFVTQFLKKKEAVRSQLKLAARKAVDGLYDFVLTGVEKMLTSMPEMNYSQVEEAAQNMLAEGIQTLRGDIQQQRPASKHFLAENSLSFGSSSYLPTGDDVYSNPIQPVPSKKRRFIIGKTQNALLSSDVNRELYSPTSNYKTNSSVSVGKNDNNNSLDDSIQDDDDGLENANNESSRKRYQVAKKDVDASNFFSDDSEEEQEFLSKPIENYITESLSCMQCDEEFGDQGSLNAHNLKKHQTQIYSCPLQMCNKSFKFLNELAGHAKQHSNVASWDCYVCSFNGLDMDELSKHLSQEHENGKFRCIKEGCSVVSSTRADAERHFTSGNHISSQNANDAGQPDEDDDEQEASSSDFQNSNFPSIFMNGKKFRIDSIKCFNDDCQFYFKNETDLRQHMLILHKMTFFTCPVVGCSNPFDSKKQLKKHAKKDHSDNGNNWSCPTCGHVEESLQQFIVHQHQLHVEGIYICSICHASSNCGQEAEEHYDIEHDA